MSTDDEFIYIKVKKSEVYKLKGLDCSKRWHQCSDCGKDFESRACLDRHVGSGVHLKDKRFFCQQCSMGFAFNSTLVEHIKNDHQNDFKKEYQCGECQIIFLVKEHLIKHLQLKHNPSTDNLDGSAPGGSIEGEKNDPEVLLPANVKHEKVTFEEDFEQHDAVPEVYDDDDDDFDDQMLEQQEEEEVTFQEYNTDEELIQEEDEEEEAEDEESTQNDGSPEDEFVCEFCKRSFKNRYRLKRHVDNVHSKIKRFFCPCCQLGFYFKARLETHLKLDHPEEEIKLDPKEAQPADQLLCDQCSKAFNSRSALQRHIDSVHLKIKNFFCPHCEMGFYFKKNFKNHVKSRHPDQETDQDLFLCEECARPFRKRSCLKAHVDRVHAKIRNFSCSHCEKKFFQKYSLKLHIKKMHDRQREFSCPECKVVFQEKSHLINHMRVKHDKLDDSSVLPDESQGAEESKQVEGELPERFPCSECDKDFASKQILKRHKRFVHQKVRNVKCPLCPATFTINYYLRMHLATVDHGEKSSADLTILCQHCGQIFKTAEDLKAHSKEYHSRGNRFFCEFCNLGFAKMRHVKAHIQSQHSEVFNKYFCKYCELGFPQKHQLIAHVLADHKDKKDYKNCKGLKRRPREPAEVKAEDSSDSFLSSSVNSSDDVSLHFATPVDNTVKISAESSPQNKKRIPARPIDPCEYCGKYFQRKDHLVQHVNQVHLKIRKFKCKLCDRSFARKNGLDCHIVLFHKQIINQTPSVVNDFMKYAV